MRCLLILCAMLAMATNAAAESAASPGAEAVEEILIVGEQPGPGLWKVSRGGHELWILGVLFPLPQKMVWRPQEVETLLGQSQELIAPPYANLQIGFFKQLLLLPSLLTLENNPDGEKLQAVLPQELYARWTPLKEKYIGRDKSIEKKRPIFASQQLYAQAIEKTGLTRDGALVWSVVDKIVKDHNIKKTAPGFSQKFKQPGKALSEFKQASLADTECFAKTLERLETDLDAMRARANAWAVGDLAALRKLPYPDQDQACNDAILNSKVLEEQGFGDILARTKQLWLESAEAALANNQTTFAVLDIAELLKPEGYLAALKEKGYAVEEP